MVTVILHLQRAFICLRIQSHGEINGAGIDKHDSDRSIGPNTRSDK